jgi:hypothetical protein
MGLTAEAKTRMLVPTRQPVIAAERQQQGKRTKG